MACPDETLRTLPGERDEPDNPQSDAVETKFIADATRISDLTTATWCLAAKSGSRNFSTLRTTNEGQPETFNVPATYETILAVLMFFTPLLLPRVLAFNAFAPGRIMGIDADSRDGMSQPSFWLTWSWSMHWPESREPEEGNILKITEFDVRT